MNKLTAALAAALVAALAAVALLAECSKGTQSRSQQVRVDRERTTVAKPSSSGPHDRAPTIDPRSTEAALELVQFFVQLLNRRHFDEAYMLLGPTAPARREFDQALTPLTNLHASTGTPGVQEGAAGSVYLSVPLTVSGKLEGKDVRRSETVVVRRSNDIPGSTDAERHWHIERVERTD